MSEYRERLKAMSDAWKTGREQPEGVPPGIYHMQLQDVELTESQSSGKLMVHWTHLITDGEQSGETVHDYQGVEQERSAFFIGLRIEQLGFEIPDDPEDLEEVLAAIADAAPSYRGRVTRSKEGFTNVRILNLLDSGEAPPLRKTVKKKSRASSGIKTEDSLVGQTVIYKEDGEECEVVSQGGTNLVIKDANGDEYACTVDDIEIGGSGGEEDSGEAEQDEELIGEGTRLEEQGEPETDENLDELIAFCQSQEVEVTDGDTVEVLIERLCKFEWDASKLVKEEVALLESIGADVKRPRAPKVAEKKTGKKKGKKKKARK